MELTFEKTDNGYPWAVIKKGLDNLPNGTHSLKTTIAHKIRTDQQRMWLFGGIYPMMLKGLLDAGFEYTNTEQVHKFCKDLFTHEEILNRYTGQIIKLPGTTTKMTTVECMAFCDKIREWSQEYLGVEIPDPIKNRYEEHPE